MDFELINTGTELLLGRTLNTHQLWVCRELADRGYLVSRQTAVPDTGPAIELSGARSPDSGGLGDHHRRTRTHKR
jgi:molybdopterin-biosynthesis enzyme MoeA-like protein